MDGGIIAGEAARRQYGTPEGECDRMLGGEGGGMADTELDIPAYNPPEVGEYEYAPLLPALAIAAIVISIAVFLQGGFKGEHRQRRDIGDASTLIYSSTAGEPTRRP